MTTYGSYGRGSSMLSPYILMFALVAVAACCMILLLEAGKEPIETPRPVYNEPSEYTEGVNIDEAVEEARSLLPNLVAGGEKEYLTKTTGGLLRVLKDRNGEVFVVGHNNEEDLLVAAKEIAEELGATVGDW